MYRPSRLMRMNMKLISRSIAVVPSEAPPGDPAASESDLTSLPVGHYAIAREPSSGSYVSELTISAGKKVELKPGGYHLMLMGLKAPLKDGEKLPLTLKFEKAGAVVVTVNVESPKPSEAATEHKH